MSTEVIASPAYRGGYRAPDGRFNIQTGADYAGSSISIATASNTTRVYTRIAVTSNFYRNQANRPDNFPYSQSGGAQTPYAFLSLTDGFDNLMVNYGRVWGLDGDDLVLIDRKTPLVIPEFSKIKITSNGTFFVHYTFHLLS